MLRVMIELIPTYWGFRTLVLSIFSSECESLKSHTRVRFIREKFLAHETTHLIVGVLQPTDKVLAAIAKGIWILPQSYLVGLS